MVKNLKFNWCDSTSVSNKEFLGWLYDRLQNVFGEHCNLDYMKRLERIIDAYTCAIPAGPPDPRSEVINEMPTKHIMTRAEAIAKLSEAVVGPNYSAAKIIDFYIAAGMLEIKEETKTPILAELIQNKLKEKGINVSITIIGEVLAVNHAVNYKQNNS